MRVGAQGCGEPKAWVRVEQAAQGPGRIGAAKPRAWVGVRAERPRARMGMGAEGPGPG